MLILAHSIVLMVGGHYTYAEVPLFDTLGDWLGWQRNNYDKLGHFMQGFAPAMIARELLVRLRGDQRRGLAELLHHLFLPGAVGASTSCWSGGWPC